MYNLIIKEFLVQKKTLLYGLVYTLLAAFLFKDFMPDGGALYIIAPVAVIYLFVNYSCGYDDKNKADVIFNSLPIKREEIVWSKYIAIFFFAAYGIVCSALMGLICRYMDLPYISRLISLKDVIITLSCSVTFGSIFYPLYFKFGMVKMRLVNVFLFMAIMFLPSIITELIQNNPENPAIKAVTQFFTDTPVWIIRMLTAVAMLAAFLVSVLISMKIYKNKEF